MHPLTLIPEFRMPSETAVIVEEALQNGNLSNLIGLAEGVDFEAKGSEPYDFTTARGRYELAKDISALANSEGGWVLVGVVTEKSEAEAIDRVTALDWIEESNFPGEQIRGLLREYIFPPIKDLVVYWREDLARPGLGIGAIHVPKQVPDKLPFLVAKVVEESERIREIVFGYVRRIADSSNPHTLQQLHNSMNRGLHPVGQRLASIEEALQLLIERGLAPEVPMQDGITEELRTVVDQRVSALLTSRGTEGPYYVVGVVPSGTRVRGFFGGGGDLVFKLLTNSPTFRYSGFHIHTGDAAKLIGSDYWEARNGDRKILRLYQDGMLLFGVRADAGFLAWGQHADIYPDFVRFNPVAVVETHTSFVYAYAKIIGQLTSSPETVHFVLRFHDANVHGRRLALTAYYAKGIDNVIDPPAYPIHASNATAEVDVSAELLLRTQVLRLSAC